MRRRAIAFAAAIAAAATVVTAYVFLTNPLRRSDESVRSYLLGLVPTGSTVDALRAAADREGWNVKGAWERGPNSDWGGIDGATVARVHLGSYRTILQTDLDSFWAFDEHGKLIDVQVRRMTDAP